MDRGNRDLLLGPKPSPVSSVSLAPMASLLTKLLKKPPPPLQILASLNKLQSPNPALSDLPPQNAFQFTNPNLNPLLPSFTDILERESFLPFHHYSLHIYPDLPNCSHMQPHPLTGFDRSDDVESGGELVVSEDAGGDQMVWADSVKKKRKKKMNKHKYKKLRKRLRRQT